MPVLKPVRGIRLNKSHPLARGLVGYWLLNEGSGNKVGDLSGNGNTGTFTGTAPSWSSGKFGSAVLLPSTDEYIDVGTQIITQTNNVSFGAWFNWSGTTGSNQVIILNGATDAAGGYALILRATSSDYVVIQNGGVGIAVSNFKPTVGVWYYVIAVRDTGTWKLYVNGIQKTLDANPIPNTPDGITRIGANQVPAEFFNGLIDIPMIHNRALPASEIALLHREPFCMLAKAWRPRFISGQIVELAGTAAGTSNVDGSLGTIEIPPEMERSWLKEALFNGMTANAFKLGTSLSLGWFWVRVAGCSALYRGSSGGMVEIDFANILTVSNLDASEISPPSYISHDGGGGGSTYFYVVRRFNNCGYQEHTLTAAVKVSIKPNGELAEPQPNNIFSPKAEQVDSNKVRLTWFYCPLEQGSKPVCFNIYYDDRTGQIDYQNPLATIGYKGRKFYSFQSSALEAGKYLFAIRAEDAGGIENISLARLKIQLDTLNPDAIDILRAEAV